MKDERRGRQSRPAEDYSDADMTLPNALRPEQRGRATGSTTQKALPAPPAGMALPPSPAPVFERVSRTTASGMPAPVPGLAAERVPRSTSSEPPTQQGRTADNADVIARQVAHAAAQLNAREQARDTGRDPARETVRDPPREPAARELVREPAREPIPEPVIPERAAEVPPVRNTTVFHRAALGSDISELVRVQRLPATHPFDPRLFMLTAPDSAAAASFRVLRHRLIERLSGKVILVTSPRAAEGKTVCAANLALALGEAARARVALLETNFRNPSLARLLGFQPPVCLREQLERHRMLPTQPWVVVENVAPWLHCAAVAPETPSGPILDGPMVARCIENFRRAGYDFIVIDSPAILGSADVNLIEESADGILIALWSRRSRGRVLRRAIEQIGKTKLLGSVLLGT